MAHHEMWNDELQSWLIARDSTSLSELHSNLTYQGHPFLWYLCLYVLAKLTHNPVIMQVLHLIIATGVVYVFLFFSPFNKLQKFLFCFSYFPLYEYGIISRNYSLGILFIFIFCALYSQPKRNYILLSLCLAWSSQTNVYSLIISLALALMIFGTEILKSIINNKKLSSKLHFFVAIGIYLIGLLTASAQIIRARGDSNIWNLESTANVTFQPVADLAIQHNNYNSIAVLSDLYTSISDYSTVLTGIWRSYIPIPDTSSQYLWGSNFLLDTQKLYLGTTNLFPLITSIASLLLFLFFIAVFSKQKKVLFIYISGTVAIYIFGFVAKIPLLRHNGHLFILLMICYWLLHSSNKEKRSQKRMRESKLISFARKEQTVVFTIIMFIQLYAGMELYIRDLIQPFSNINGVVEFIRTNQLEESLIIGSRDNNTLALSAWLNRKIYYPEIAGFGTYTVSTPESVPRNINISESEIIQQAQKLEQESNQNILLVMNKQLKINLEDSNIRLIAAFKEQSLINDKFFVYLVE